MLNLSVEIIFFAEFYSYAEKNTYICTQNQYKT